MKDKYGCIYKISNTINDKLYIGKTINDPEIRLDQHIRLAMNANKSTKSTKFQYAILKHGASQFSVSVIKYCDDTDSLNKSEIEEIAKFDSFNKGYNSTLGGEGGVNLASVEARNIPIICLNTNKKYKSSREAGRDLDISYKLINSVCRGTKRTAHGYVFDYDTVCIDDILDFQLKRGSIKVPNMHTKVRCLSTGVIYNSFLDASKDTNTNTATIANHCNRLVKKHRFEFCNIQKLLFVGDYHCKISNMPDSEKLMKFIIKTAEDRCVDAIVFSGDQFHNHAVIRMEVLDFWDRSLKLLNLSCPTYFLTGNHDMKGDNETEAVDIGAMKVFDTKNVLLENITIIDKPTNVEGILMVPFYKNENTFLSQCKEYYEKGCHNLIIAHQTFTGAQYENGFFSEEGIDPALVPQGQILSGHIHKSQDVGKCFYPGTPKWDTMSDANQDKGLYIFDFSHDKKILNKEFISTKEIVTPITSYTVKEGEELPELNPDARNYVVLEGKSVWITKMKKKLKNIAQVKVKPTDRKSIANNDNTMTLEKYLDSEFEPIVGVKKEDIKKHLVNL